MYLHTQDRAGRMHAGRRETSNEAKRSTEGTFVVAQKDYYY